MPVARLRALECRETEDLTGADSCRLEISVDGVRVDTLRKDLNTGQRWLLERSYRFELDVSAKLWDEDWPDGDDELGTFRIRPQLVHRKSSAVKGDEAHYVLWYEVIEEGVEPAEAHRLGAVRVRQMLGRLGRGVMTEAEHQELIGRSSLYRCEEVLSVKQVFERHAAQDGGRGGRASVKAWIAQHCNPWGEESVIPLSAIPQGLSAAEIAAGASNWAPIRDEETYFVAGSQQSSYLVAEDYPFSHETLDWCWNQIVDPAFTYLLCYTSPTRSPSSGREFAYIHNEQENGSLPTQWRPFCGEYVTVWGRHVYDKGHAPVKTETHPAPFILREHTTAAPLGDGGALVPANRAILGMGFSGGFPGKVGDRWERETGGIPDGIWGDTTDCWATNLKKRRMRFPLYPPVARPSQSAQLRWRVTLCEIIAASSWDRVDDFLEICQEDDPAEGERGFRSWSRTEEWPKGFVPQEAPSDLHPRVTLQRDAFLEVEVDLGAAPGIPVGYHAVIDCGWSEPGPHTICGFDVTFESILAVQTSSYEHWDDWHLHYGVNGQWVAWWTDDFITEGSTYERNTSFRIYTVDDNPLSIRDGGIEWEGLDFTNSYLARVAITAPGPDHFGRIAGSEGVSVLSWTGDTLRFKAAALMGKGGTRHEWTILIRRFL